MIDGRGTTRLGNREARRRGTSVNNNSENRVAFISVNNLLPPSPPTPDFSSSHFHCALTSVICSSVSVISVFSQWECRRKEGPRDGGKTGDRLEEQDSWPRGGGSIWFGVRMGVGGRGGEGILRFLITLFACCYHKHAGNNTGWLEGVLLSLMANVR